MIAVTAFTVNCEAKLQSKTSRSLLIIPIGPILLPVPPDCDAEFDLGSDESDFFYEQSITVYDSQ